MKNKDLIRICWEGFVGVLHFEGGGGGKNHSLHTNGEGLWGRAELHFGRTTLRKQAILSYVRKDSFAFQGKKIDSFPSPCGERFVTWRRICEKG